MIPIYTNKKLITAFEYGIIFSQVAREHGVELTQEKILKMEEIIKKEFPKKGFRRLNLEMAVNILASFEL